MDKVINEPIKHFLEKYGIDILNIKEIICGRKYSAVLLTDGNIGVCANLLNKVEVKIEDLRIPQVNNIEHRIILNAYFNGMLNYLNCYGKMIDIFDSIDFQSYKNLVMVGLFKPLLKKFRYYNIKVQVFDKIKESSNLISEEKKNEYVRKADAIILSATSIVNNTFLEVVNHTGDNCDIFVLGPSSIMHKDIFEYKNIKRIFGSIFKSNDEKVLNIIKSGYGTKKFLPFGKKVYL
ncbi:MAG: hypothetical protein KAT17_01720 [Candidatus Aminicenantes bacterium]|nr:hypothetical protein [Candidatus Aminicenantes bacterium]